MNAINIEQKKINNSELRHIVRNNMCFNRDNTITYDFDFYDVKYKGYLVGYIVKHNILACKTIEYIDIYICNNFRSKGIGSEVLKYFIANYCTKETVGILSTNKDKIRFLERNGFKYDDVYIYKNLYKYKRNDLNAKN